MAEASLPADRQAAVDAVARASQATLPDDLMMSLEQVRGLHLAGMSMGVHTVSHPILARLDRDAARRETVAGRRDLEAVTGASVKAFAYPNGKPGEDYDDGAVTFVRDEGFASAASRLRRLLVPTSAAVLREPVGVLRSNDRR